MAHTESQLSDSQACNQERVGTDGRADATAAVALIVLAVAIAVFWVAGQ